MIVRKLKILFNYINDKAKGMVQPIKFQYLSVIGGDSTSYTNWVFYINDSIHNYFSHFTSNNLNRKICSIKFNLEIVKLCIIFSSTNVKCF